MAEARLHIPRNESGKCRRSGLEHVEPAEYVQHPVSMACPEGLRTPVCYMYIGSKCFLHMFFSGLDTGYTGIWTLWGKNRRR